VLLTHEEEERNAGIAKSLRLRGIDIALRGGKLRISPHVHNSRRDVDDLLEAFDVLSRTS
jgi:selenocysteine lyase/cysteine desulfurase